MPLVNQGEASILGETYQVIKQRIGIENDKPLHWVDYSHARKKAIIDELAQCSFIFCTVLVDTEHSDIVNTNPQLKGKRLYFYTFRHLVERITWYCDDQGCKVRLNVENKGGINYEELNGYLAYIQRQPDCEIRPNCILSVKPKPKSQSKLVQLTDSICGAVQNAVEHKYGLIEDSYFMALSDKLYRRNGILFGYGLKFVPHKSGQIPSVLGSTYPWLDRL